MNPMGLSDPWVESVEIIALRPVIKMQGMNPMVLSAYWENSFDMASLRPVRKIMRYEPNGPYFPMV